MALLFKHVKLSDVHTARNVVNNSIGIRTTNGEVEFVVAAEFGTMGKLRRRVRLYPVTTQHEIVKKQLDEYVGDLLELIGIFEELKRFVKNSLAKPVENGVGDIFNRVLCTEVPVMVHCVRAPKSYNLQIFTEGAYDLEIKYNYEESPMAQKNFFGKVDDLIKLLQNHIVHIENTPANEIFKGANK